MMTSITPEQQAVQDAISHADSIRDAVTRVHLGGSLDEISVYESISYIYAVLLGVRDKLDDASRIDGLTRKWQDAAIRDQMDWPER